MIPKELRDGKYADVTSIYDLTWDNGANGNAVSSDDVGERYFLDPEGGRITKVASLNGTLANEYEYLRNTIRI